MAYTLEIRETIPSAIPRIASELVNYQLEQLKDTDNNRDEAIHETRKAFKQLRALIRFVRSELGEESYQRLNAYYRDLSQKLAPLREAYVNIESLDKVIKEIEDEDLLASAKSIRKALMKNYRSVRRNLLKKSAVVNEVIAALETHLVELGTLSLKRDKFAAIEANLARIYRQGQSYFKIAKKSQSVEDYHDWRKAVKYLWYHTRLLENMLTESQKTLITDLKTLSDYLGNAHDFAELQNFLAGQEEWQGEKEQMLLAILQTRQRELETQAESLGKQLYAQKSQKFITSLKKAWKARQFLSA